MPESIWVVLIPALSAAFVASVALLRQVLSERSKQRAARTEAHLGDNDRLLEQYRRMNLDYKAEAEDARAGEAREREARHAAEAAARREREAREAAEERERVAVGRARAAEDVVQKWNLGREGL